MLSIQLILTTPNIMMVSMFYNHILVPDIAAKINLESQDQKLCTIGTGKVIGLFLEYQIDFKSVEALGLEGHTYLLSSSCLTQG